MGRFFFYAVLALVGAQFLIVWDESCLGLGIPTPSNIDHDIRNRVWREMVHEKRLSELAIVLQNLGRSNEGIESLEHVLIDILPADLTDIATVLEEHDCVQVEVDANVLDTSNEEIVVGPPPTPTLGNTPSNWLKQSGGFNDPWARYQWYYGSTVEGSSTPVGMDWVDAWKRHASPQPVTIALLGSECPMENEELNWDRTRICPKGDPCVNWNFVSSSADAGSRDSHGTGIGSLMASKTDNSLGIVGSCEYCQLFCGRVADVTGTVRPSAIVRAINWIASSGIKISLHNYSHTTYSAAASQAFERSRGFDHIHVAAAGDDSMPLGQHAYLYPAFYSSPNILTVGASNRQGKVAGFSNWGRHVDVFAPGEDVIGVWDINAQKLIGATGSALSAALVAAALGHTLTYYPNHYHGDTLLAVALLAAPYGEIRQVDGRSGILDVKRLLDIVDRDSEPGSTPKPDSAVASSLFALTVTTVILLL
ncbi:MAG: uncharacterized protein KVP18_003842 [Porospora cf. gigantea A]|uniref:uncharacterized protein n=1 Tax=Porospora cf. gigantea A TaxID=2853593 RepID=UPI003559B0C8|nr:MAG: hypothetical protein KVP18_003842 [Porospora cf. gigantea A]